MSTTGWLDKYTIGTMTPATAVAKRQASKPDASPDSMDGLEIKSLSLAG